MSHATHASMRRQGERDHHDKVRHLAGGGSVDAKIAKAVHEHEEHDHKGEAKTKIKLKHGGAVEGHHGKKRLDRPGRASGGRTKHKGGSKGAHVNVIVAPQGGGHPQMPPPMPPPAGAMPPHPPVPPPAPPPGGGPPGMPAGGMPPRPPMAGPPVGAGVPMHAAGGRVGRKDGGKVGPMENAKMKPSREPGGGSGEGRLKKSAAAAHAKMGENKSASEHSPEEMP